MFEHLFESCEHLPEPSLLITRSLPMLFEYLRATHAVAPNGVQPFVQASWLQVRPRPLAVIGLLIPQSLKKSLVDLLTECLVRTP